MNKRLSTESGGGFLQIIARSLRSLCFFVFEGGEGLAQPL
ncbi:hypothetical protein HNP72_001077 [Sphingobacterium soli]|nr:hypothetical protein [Sphingobacterium soli]